MINLMIHILIHNYYKSYYEFQKLKTIKSPSKNIELIRLFIPITFVGFELNSSDSLITLN